MNCGQAVTFRRIDPLTDDMEDLLKVIREAFGAMRGVVNPPSSAFRLTAALLAQKARQETGIAAFSPQGPVACVFCEVRPNIIHVGKLAVHPAWQGRGLGRRLLHEAILLARRSCRPEWNSQRIIVSSPPWASSGQGKGPIRALPFPHGLSCAGRCGPIRRSEMARDAPPFAATGQAGYELALRLVR